MGGEDGGWWEGVWSFCFTVSYWNEKKGEKRKEKRVRK